MKTRKEYARTYYLKHRERILAYQREYNRAHPKILSDEERKELNEYRRMKYAANREQCRKYAREYYRKHK